jgi:hypothetical protein
MAGMQHKLFHFHVRVFSARGLWTEEIVALVVAALVVFSPAQALIRFETRQLMMQSSTPGATTNYTISIGYNSPVAVGSLNMLFCIDPIPYMPCDPPAGLDVSQATLSSQTGETGFTIASQTTNHIVLTRNPSVPLTSGVSSYTLSGVVNPTDIGHSFAIRLASYESTDASGPLINGGAVTGQVTNAIVIQTQVPPMLIFCFSRAVEYNCTGTDDTYYTDMGTLSSTQTLTAESQMAVGTNATQGFVITANGGPPAAGTNVIPGTSVPAPSTKGTNQFGINLVANTAPIVGSDPEGTWANAIASPDYGVPNEYKYVPGDVVAYSPNVSLMKKFTVSYILNSSENLHPGVYSTTITFVASGRF